jgi:hypothetical protein
LGETKRGTSPTRCTASSNFHPQHLSYSLHQASCLRALREITSRKRAILLLITSIGEVRRNMYVSLSFFATCSLASIVRPATNRYFALQAQKNPNSALSGPGPQFKSRWSDPTHPANNSSLISLVSGRVINRQDKDKDKDKDDRKSRRRRRRSSSSSSSGSDRDREGKGPGLIGGLKGAVAGPGGQDQGLIEGAKGRMMQTVR